MCQLKTNRSQQLICVFVFAYADCWFSHVAAHILCRYMYNEIATRQRPFDSYGGGAGRKKYLGQVKFYRTYCIIYKRQDRVASEKKMSRPENIFQPSFPPPPHKNQMVAS